MNPRELLPEYVLGTLEPAEVAAVEVLLARSAEARAELRHLRASLVTLTEALPPEQPPARVWEALQVRLEPPPTVVPVPPVVQLPKQSPSSYLGWALAACLALVAVGQVAWLGSSRSELREARRNALLVADFLGAPEAARITLRGRERQGLGSLLTRPDGGALFVLGQPPADGRSYQAWGHTNDDWEPGSREQLTSLGVSRDPVFEVETQSYAALYLSLEPAGGSLQPTYPLSRVSLLEPVATSPLSVTSPTDGSIIDQTSVIVTGVVDTNVTELSYVLNGEARQTTTVGSRFTFTATLRRGENTLVVRAKSPEGVAATTLTLTRP